MIICPRYKDTKMTNPETDTDNSRDLVLVRRFDAHAISFSGHGPTRKPWCNGVVLTVSRRWATDLKPGPAADTAPA